MNNQTVIYNHLHKIQFCLIDGNKKISFIDILNDNELNNY